MRSRAANVSLLLVGMILAGLGISFYSEYELAFGTIDLVLGLWCVAGAIGNLRNLQRIRQAPMRSSDSLVRWHLRILAVAIVCEISAAVTYSRDLIPASGFKIAH